FTNAYSVFDWGPMPDKIPRKGPSLCTMGADTFERLADHGVPTHYQGVIVDGDPSSLAAARTPPTELAFDLARVPELPETNRRYDYDAYFDAASTNVLVPLEVVVRNAVPVGSSLRRRRSPRDCGLDQANWPDHPVALPEPLVEFSTKLEASDRYLDRQEAAAIAGPVALPELEELALAVNEVITARAEAVGLTHQDGKIECVLTDGTLRVGDVAGTLDENRFRYQDQQLSKELLREYHRQHQSTWVEAVTAAKTAARQDSRTDWREQCSRSPTPLPTPVVATVSKLYATATDAYTGRDWFGVGSLETAASAAEQLTAPGG
ncbi:MAG: phosphoribosylaminoimidazolesuccinocarboxamide (SAICAR) synthase, partial [halophilic archaeon J07HX5]